MSYEFKTIQELLNDDYRQQKQFTIEELANYDGSNGKPIYVAVEGIVYDLSKVGPWSGGTHFGLKAGKDLTEEFNLHHGIKKVLNRLPKVGTLMVKKEENNTSLTRVPMEETYDFSPDDWIQYITPLVNDALEEATAGINLQHLFQKYIMIGIRVGQGMNFEEAIGEIDNWEKSGISKLLDESKRNND